MCGVQTEKDIKGGGDDKEQSFQVNVSLKFLMPNHSGLKV